ncbi:hypothetical protein FQR65_LT06075 [Abscondita terminalis]|nr:hypothetical protein FQR65_LT06075 [Abscondita terminalis]
MSNYYTRPLSMRELEAIIEEDFSIVKANTIDAVYIPPTVDELTDEEDIDDDLLEENSRPSDRAGTNVLLQKPTTIWQKEKIEFSTSSSKESVRKEKLLNLLENKTPTELFSLLIDDDLMLQIVKFSEKRGLRKRAGVLWLQGGPGESSMSGLFLENGPFVVTPEFNVEIRPYRWTKQFSMIYIDNPVGTGFSFTDEGGYVENQTVIGEHLYEAFQQFYELFPEIRKNKLYLTGQSYAGKYLPALAYKILKENSNGKNKIWLHGLAIGNAYADPINQFDYSEYLYQIGLVDFKVKEQMREMGKKAVKHIENEEWLQALGVFGDLIYEARENTLFQNSSGFMEPMNFLEVKSSACKNYISFLQRADVRNAIHVGNSTYNDAVRVAEYLEEDFSQSVAPWISELLEHYRVMFYNGQVDLIVPYPLVLNVLKKLKFSGADEYKEAPRRKWYVGDELAGYVKQGGNLVEAMVRLAGHNVPYDQPEWAYDLITRSGQNDENTDLPLLLTDLIHSGKFQEAKAKAKVKYDKFKHVKSYAGYFTVNKEFNSNTFFWFFPAEEYYENAPLLLWLQGGPGDSSLLGLFMENGPFIVTSDLNIEIRPYRWSQKFPMLYLDNPVGTGFSFTDEGGYAQNQTIIGEHLFEALNQFYLLFPELRNTKLFLTGESYACKYIPALAYKILKENSNGKQIRLEGLAIGNGYCDPINQYDYCEYLYQIGLIDSNVKEQLHEMELKAIKHIENKEWLPALDIFAELIYEARNNILFQNSTEYFEPVNFLQLKANSQNNFKTFLQRRDVRNAIHVGNSTFHDSDLVLNYLREDFCQSVAPWISELLEHYRIMFYNGQVDLIVPYPLVVNVLKQLKFSGADEYKKAPRHKWYVGEDLAGYLKQGGNLVEAMVRLAGHKVPLDQPEWSFDLITRFVHNELIDV